MNGRVKGFLALLVLMLILLVGGFYGVPRVVGALPGEFRVRLARIPLMEPMLEMGRTSLPSALPAPSIAAE